MQSKQSWQSSFRKRLFPIEPTEGALYVVDVVHRSGAVESSSRTFPVGNECLFVTRVRDLPEVGPVAAPPVDALLSISVGTKEADHDGNFVSLSKRSEYVPAVEKAAQD